MRVSVWMFTMVLFAWSWAGCGGSGSETRTPDAEEPSAGGDAAIDQAPPDISGAWSSPCTPDGQGSFFVLDFDLSETDWALDYQTFGDDTCDTRFLTVHIEGPYELVAPSDEVAGAWNGIFRFDEKTVTPHQEAAAGFLGSEGGCGGGDFTVGEATPVYEGGCAGIGQYPEAACSADYDLVALEGDTLRFGARPADNDMCSPEKRPTELSPLGLTRS